MYSNLHPVLPDFGGPMIAILIGTTGLGEGCFKKRDGHCMNVSRSSRPEQK